MKVKDAIEEAARFFAGRRMFTPSACDIRMTLNDLVSNHDYNQTRAVKSVQRILAALKKYT